MNLSVVLQSQFAVGFGRLVVLCLVEAVRIHHGNLGLLALDTEVIEGIQGSYDVQILQQYVAKLVSEQHAVVDSYLILANLLDVRDSIELVVRVGNNYILLTLSIIDDHLEFIPNDQGFRILTGLRLQSAFR